MPKRKAINNNAVGQIAPRIVSLLLTDQLGAPGFHACTRLVNSMRATLADFNRYAELVYATPRTFTEAQVQEMFDARLWATLNGNKRQMLVAAVNKEVGAVRLVLAGQLKFLTDYLKTIEAGSPEVQQAIQDDMRRQMGWTEAEIEQGFLNPDTDEEPEQPMTTAERVEHYAQNVLGLPPLDFD